MIGTLQFGSTLGTREHGAATWTLTRQSADVRTAANAADGPTVFWEEQEINLTAAEIQDKTVFFGSVMPQYLGGFSAEGLYAGAGASSFFCNEVVVMSERILTDPVSSLVAMANQSPPPTTIGGASGSFDPQNVLYGHFKNFTFSGPIADAAGQLVGGVSPYLTMNVNNSWGSGVASANDKMYCYRCVVFGDTSDGGSGSLSIGMPEMNIVYTIETEKEDELVYFNRIRRSWMDRVG